MHDRDLAACRTLLRSGSRSFYAAAFLLPQRVRDPATALYAFCRIADDVIDLAGGDASAIAALRARISAACSGNPQASPYDRAFSAALRQHGIPQSLPDALIQGFAWDVELRRYETIDDLLGYAARVAGTVGAMMCLLMGRRDGAALARASELGMAMQLSNIARDVGEDARNGRFYLPLAWCREEGVDVDQWMANPQFDGKIGRVVSRLLETADELYRRADYGIALLPGDCRRGIRAARLLYSEIGIEVERRRFDSVSSRAVVGGWRKVGVLVRAMLPPEVQAGVSPLRMSQSRAGQPADDQSFGHGFSLIEASRFLVEAASDARPLAAQARVKWWDLYGQALHVIQLFEALEKRQRAFAARELSGRDIFARAADGT